MNVTADPVTRESTASGTITIPDTSGGEEEEGSTVDVSLPVTWSEDGKALVYVTYELNDSEITTFYPVETWGSGKHILTLYYPLTGIASDVINYFKVHLKMTGGTGLVEIGGCIASISGQALGASYVWDGELEFEDEYTNFTIGGGINVKGMAEDFGYVMIEQKEYGYSQTASKVSIGAYCRPIEED